MTTTPTHLHLDFHGTLLDLDVAPGADVASALAFLGTHLAALPARPDTRLRSPLATLRIAAAPDARHTPPGTAAWEDIHLRKSASEFFTVPARRTTLDDREYLECTKTGSRLTFDRTARTVDVALGRDGAMDLVELVRDLVLKDQENSGAAVLHATAAYRDGTAVLVTGAKGAGKSTLLLELVEHFGYRILSGDKTVLHERPDGSVLAAGWPDYPHLGYGTVAKYPGLKEIAGLSDDYEPRADHAFSPLGKFAVHPVRFRERFPSAPLGAHVPVTAILHPAIGPGEHTLVEPAADGTEAQEAQLRANLESAFDGAHACWHHYADDLRERTADRRDRITRALADVPAWTVTGPGDLTPQNTPALIADSTAGGPA
ncbi:hypothetical protein [Streptomyces sp. NPDC048606]|uniref:hypothetical protein n=1 Tax=Streptomyces sp. NPDC048606 TaxID=3154726 RepID=UPI00342F95AA